MNLISYTPRSPDAIAILIQAVEFVRDYEGDMCHDLSYNLKDYRDQRFDSTLADIVNMRRRVVFATNMVTSLKSMKVGETVHFNQLGLEVINCGLELMQDQLAEEITEPLYKIERDTKDRGYTTLSTGELVQLRQAVEKNIDRAEVGAELFKEFRALAR